MSASGGNGSNVAGSGGNGNGNGNGASAVGRGRGRSVKNEDYDGPGTTSGSDTDRSRKRKEEEKTQASRGRSRDEHKFPTALSRSDYIKTRPDAVGDKTGSTGTQVNLLTNYFRMKYNSSFEFCQYRVDFYPENDNVKIRKAMVYQHAETLRGYVYDGDHIIYLMHRLPDREFASRTREGEDYKIKLKSTGVQISLTDGMGLMVLNIMLRRAMEGLKLQEVQRNLYDPANAIDLRDWKLELWPGYITSIRQHERNVLLCCEISHKVMRQETCLDVLRALTRDGVNYREAFERDVVGTVVLTGYNNRTYSIAGVNWEMTPASRFETRDGETSFIDYYRTRYQLTIREARQPLLLARLSARDIRGGREQQALLVPELCRTTGLTDGMRANFQMMKALGEYMRMPPAGRVKRLTDFSRRLRDTPASQEVLRKFNVEMESDLVKLSGRLLPTEQILFGNGKAASYEAATADWTPAIRNNTMYTNESLKKWIAIFPKKIAKEVNDFIQLLIEVANGLRYDVSRPKMIELADDRVTSYSNQVSEAVKMDPKMIMCFFMGNQPTNAARYAAIKKLTYVTGSVPSQCILSKTITPKKGAAIGSIRSVATKVVLQLNSKLGGAPWMIKMPLKGVLIAGFDVSHSTTNRSQSFGAFVASMDLQKSVKFYSGVSPHTNGEECSNNIKVHMSKALLCFRNEHGCLPERVLFYRDGVGEGQIEQIYQQEVRELIESLKVVYGPKNTEQIKFAFVIVNKRINTRFFIEQQRGRAGNGNQFDNPQSGCVVDDVVTLPERYDFFLISQSVRQGTVSPTSYNIIHDTMGLPPDRMQQLTYKMCHLYYNWMGTTRVPAVVQYAHKLSVLVGQFIHQVPHPQLDQKLYYL